MSKGPNCGSCILRKVGGTGYATTDGKGTNGILLVGEALGKDEVVASRPFVGGSGRLLDRMLSRANDPETGKGLSREDFLISNIIWCRPPNNELTGAYYEEESIAHCSPYLEKVLADYRPKAIVALGNQPLRWLTGQWGIEKLRGYIFPTRYGPVVGTYHPAYIARGQFHLCRVFELDVLKALYVSRHGIPTLDKQYCTRPSHIDAAAFLARYQGAGCPPLSFDIETPYAKIEKDDDITVEPTIEDDLSYKVILRISFAFEPGVAISMPWQPPFIDIAKALLATEGDKIVWNRHFDVPRLTANGAPVAGRIYDGMDAFHFLEPSLPMGLKYAATFYCPDMEPWKLRSVSDPEWYNAADSDVALRVFLAVRERLQAQQRWNTFERHFVDLGLVLGGISAHGVLVDKERRGVARMDFEGRLEKVINDLQSLVPLELRPRQVFKLPEERLRREGKWTDGLMIKVTQALTSAEVTRLQKKEAKAREKEEKKRQREAAKLLKRQQKLEKKRTSDSRGGGKKRTSTSSHPAESATFSRTSSS